MGCNSSKHKHTALPEPHNGVHEPVHAEHRASVGAEHKAHVNRYDEQLDYDALQEPEMEQVDNGLWRDTQNVVEVHHNRHMQDV